MARRTKTEAAKTRRKILKAALDVLVEKGYERLTIEDVARRNALTKGAVYWHFKSKADLLSELVAHMTTLHTEHISKTLPLPRSLDALKAHFIARAGLVMGTSVNRKFFHMMMRLDWSSPKLEPIKQRLRQLEEGPFFIIERTLSDLQVAGMLRANVDVEIVSAVLGSMWLGLINHKIASCLQGDLAQSIDFGFSAILDSIKCVDFK